MSKELSNLHLQDWNERVRLAEASLPLLGRLFREHGVITLMYGRPIIEKPPIDILRQHRWVRMAEERELSIRDTYPLLVEMDKMKLGACRVDLGRLAVEWIHGGRKQDPAEFVREHLRDCEKLPEHVIDKPQDVVLYGFGRIGRLLARMLIQRTGRGDALRLRAIVVRRGAEEDLHKRASLLRRDSVHGRFAGSILIDEENQALIANGHFIQVIYSDSPESVDYEAYGIHDAIVIDNTGKWRDAEGLGKHLQAKGASKVILTAPGKGDIKNIVFGVNDKVIGSDDSILSAASCTTNAITPVLRAVLDEFGIIGGHVETVHSYTNDQNLIDNYHKKIRRGRAAPLNMVITETGAAKAVSKAIPELEGKLTGNSIRVPTPNVSLAILNLTLERETSVEELNQYLRKAALHSKLGQQIDYTTSTEVASSDLVGSTHAGAIDAKSTVVSENRCVIYVWYDNESGYSAQVVRVAQKVAGINYVTEPKQ
ncbi:MAG: glyceraldehyde-3-phosphate dehydrogenase [Planctomycetota bacterium]|nr:MAG: glyceraldehyde-3-phosphate dehydrogenase [Planctomycetota bacterium]